MPFASGTFSLYTPGNPVVSGTTIASTWAQNTLNDIATGLTTCVLKDGSQTITANIPMSSFKFTGLAAGSAAGHSVRWEQTAPGVLTTTGDILYASSANTPARLAIGTAGGILQVNSGATALAYLALGTKRQLASVNPGATALAYRDQITLGTPAATTSGSTVDFTGIPSGVRRITINFVGVSTNGTSIVIVQLGQSGGIEASGYLANCADLASGATTVSQFTTGFGVTGGGSAASTLRGRVVLELENSSGFTWISTVNIAATNASTVSMGAGGKSLSAELDRVRITTVNGTDAFDAGEINIQYE